MVPRGKADRIFINTSGVGIIEHDLAIGGNCARPGDKVIINGTIGDHGIAVMAQREGLDLESDISSDCAALNGLVAEILKEGEAVHVLRDPTRGGVATTIKEIALQSQVGITLREESLPLKGQSRSVAWLAHKLARQMVTARVQNLVPYLSPDAKTQVGVEYRGRRSFRIHSITIIASGSRAVSQEIPDQRLHNDIREAVIKPAFADEPIKPDDQTLIFINPMEHLMVGGPGVHSGLTGRKNDVDTYGEYARHSGNALSGKDPMRIDRVGAYAARYAAKNVVAAGLAEECEVTLSYSIGFAGPVSVQVETFGSGKRSDEELATLVERHFDFRLAGILRDFNLRHLPALHKGRFYRKLAAYGQVGRLDLDLPWEATDKAEILQGR